MNISTNQITRRRALAGAAAGFALSVSRLRAIAQQPDMAQTPATSANQARTSLHQEIEFSATPDRIFHVLLDSKEFAAFTGMAATIDPSAGGAFNTFGGLIEGRNIEIIPSSRIVQAWRPTHWDPGVYSLVKFELKPKGSETTIVLDHTGFPEGDFDSLSAGWKSHYWDPLTKFLT